MQYFNEIFLFDLSGMMLKKNSSRLFLKYFKNFLNFLRILFLFFVVAVSNFRNILEYSSKI